MTGQSWCGRARRHGLLRAAVLLGMLGLPVTHQAHAAIDSSSSNCSTGRAVSENHPVRAVAAHSSVSDAREQWFTPDAPYVAGGTLAIDKAGVSGTASPGLYTHLRRNPSTYAFPVTAAGNYFVDLFVAEPQASPGQRVWRVRAESSPVVNAVDVARAAGEHRAWHVLFSTTVTDGCLNLQVVPVVGVPLVSAVTVAYESAATGSDVGFDDEFSGAAGSTPSTDRWHFAYGGNGWGNNEQQTYTDRPDNAALDGAGHLDITARRENYTGYDGITRHYTSARLTSRDTFTFQYGSATARLRMPNGDGLLAAFWTMGRDVDTAGWPACGETDIVESRGRQPSAVYTTIHAKNSDGSPWLSSGTTQATTPFSSGFHTYTLTWGPDAIQSDVDGLPYLSVSTSDFSPQDNWPFNHPFFLLLSLAVGGNWAGKPDSTTPFPATFSIDYVRVHSP